MKKLKFAIPRIGIGVNQDLLDKQDTLDTLMNASSEDDQIEALQDLVPTEVNVNFSVLPIVTFAKKNFGLTAYTTGRIVGDFVRPTSPTLYVEGAYNTIIQAGIATTKTIKGKELFWFKSKYVIKSVVYDNGTGDDVFKFSQSDMLQYFNDTIDLDISTYSVALG